MSVPPALDRTSVCLPELRGSCGREPVLGTGDEGSCLQEVCVKVAPRAGGLQRYQGRERVLFRRKQGWESLCFRAPAIARGGPRREDAAVGALAGRAEKAETSEPRKAGLLLLCSLSSSLLPASCLAHSRCSRSCFYINERELVNEATSVGSAVLGGDTSYV